MRREAKSPHPDPERHSSLFVLIGALLTPDYRTHAVRICATRAGRGLLSGREQGLTAQVSRRPATWTPPLLSAHSKNNHVARFPLPSHEHMNDPPGRLQVFPQAGPWVGSSSHLFPCRLGAVPRSYSCLPARARTEINFAR